MTALGIAIALAVLVWFTHDWWMLLVPVAIALVASLSPWVRRVSQRFANRNAKSS
jgi:predicted PurR-regulated permease PerM